MCFVVGLLVLVEEVDCVGVVEVEIDCIYVIG